MPTLLVFIPHPDDESYAFGGTMALAALRGWRVVVEAATAGEQGERHDGVPAAPESLGQVRLEELSESCRVLGAEPPRCWRLPDGGLRETTDQSKRIQQIIKGERADLVFALGEDGAYGHPDHIALYQWVCAAWRLLGRGAPPLLLAAFPRGLFLPQYELCIGMMGTPPTPWWGFIGGVPSHYAVEIAEVRTQKLAAIRAHRSQLRGGDPNALFPGTIIQRLMGREMYSDASGLRSRQVGAILASLKEGNRPESG